MCKSGISACVILCAMCVAATGAGGEKLQDYTEKISGTVITFDMVAVPAGDFEFAIEDERPRKTAVKRFWIGKTEVTFDEFDVFRLGLDLPSQGRWEAVARGAEAGTRPSAPYSDPTWGFGHERYPALSVSHHHAKAYCEWLSRKTGQKYRLPTEAEWEYACRAGGEHALTREELDAAAWHKANSPVKEYPDGKTRRVAEKKPNAWGLYDMLGNAWEWCTTADGKPVARGASWAQVPEQVHCRARFTKIAQWAISDPLDPKSRWWLSDGNVIGFRIVREE